MGQFPGANRPRGNGFVFLQLYHLVDHYKNRLELTEMSLKRILVTTQGYSDLPSRKLQRAEFCQDSGHVADFGLSDS